MTLYIIGIVICATIFALMTLDVISDLRQSRQRMAKAINALPKDTPLTDKQREWLAKQSLNKI